MARKSAAGLMTSLDDLFSTQAERDEAKREHLIDIPLDEISDFPDHPFQVRMDEGMTDLADSIKSHGVLVPALVRPVGDSYQMVAGHRRKAASELAGAETLPWTNSMWRSSTGTRSRTAQHICFWPAAARTPWIILTMTTSGMW